MILRKRVMKTWMKVVVCVGLAAGVVGATVFWVSRGTETLKARNPDI